MAFIEPMHRNKPNITWYRVDSRFAPSQWETALLCNDVSHWLGANLESTQLVHVSWHHYVNTYRVFGEIGRLATPVRLWVSCITAFTHHVQTSVRGSDVTLSLWGDMSTHFIAIGGSLSSGGRIWTTCTISVSRNYIKCKHNLYSSAWNSSKRFYMWKAKMSLKCPCFHHSGGNSLGLPAVPFMLLWSPDNIQTANWSKIAQSLWDHCHVGQYKDTKYEAYARQFCYSKAIFLHNTMAHIFHPWWSDMWHF